MLVRELIEKLDHLDPEAEVVRSYDYDWVNERVIYRPINDVEIDTEAYFEKSEQSVAVIL